MDSISPVYLLLTAIVCSIVGRFKLVRAAWEISKGWGFAVLCVPFAPLFFRWNYKELAHEGKSWMTATAIFGTLFFGLTGSRGSVGELWAIVPEKFRPAQVAENQAPEPEESEAEEPDDSAGETPGIPAVSKMKVASKASAPAPAAAPAPGKLGFMGRIMAMVKPSSSSPEPAQPAKASVATLTPPLTVQLSLAELVAANQQEFTRLGEVYAALKKERGYLKKWDQDAIKSYNEQAAKYQADLAKARADQVELNKQIALAKR